MTLDFKLDRNTFRNKYVVSKEIIVTTNSCFKKGKIPILNR